MPEPMITIQLENLIIAGVGGMSAEITGTVSIPVSSAPHLLAAFSGAKSSKVLEDGIDELSENFNALNKHTQALRFDVRGLGDRLDAVENKTPETLIDAVARRAADGADAPEVPPHG